MGNALGTVKNGKKRCTYLIRTSKTRCIRNSRASGYCKRHEDMLFPDGWGPMDSLREPAGPSAPSAPADFYASCYTAEELAEIDFEDQKAYQLDAEIRYIRTQVRRVGEKIKKMEENPKYNPMRMYATETEVDDVAVDAEGNPMAPQRKERPPRARGAADGAQEAGDGAQGTLKRRTIQRAPDFYAIQDRLLARLAQYIRIRNELNQNGAGGTGDPGDHARIIQQMVGELDGLAHGVNLLPAEN